MKMQTLIAALMFGTLLSAPSFAQDDYEMGQEVPFPQDQQVDQAFDAWCVKGTRALERAQGQAQNAVARGQFTEAARILLTALQSGVARPSWNIKPVTWRLMVHGQRLGSALLSNSNDQRSVKAAVNALEGVYDLVLTSAQEIDRAYYRTNCGYCRGRKVRDFDQRILKMSGDLLALVNGHMTYARNGQVFPVGPAQGYLVGAQVLSAAAAGEISNLIYAESLACEIVELQDVAAELRGFNSVASSEIAKREMFGETFERIGAVTEELRAGRGCGY